MKTLVQRLRQMNEMMAAMDPGKRKLLDVFRDWRKSIDIDESELTEEERKRRYEYMLMYTPMF